MRILKKILLSFVLLISSLMLVGVALAVFTDYPASLALRYIFSKSTHTSVDYIRDLEKEVKITRNLDYGSKYKKGKLDIIVPEGLTTEKLPTIFWIHGGAFIGGDKSELEDYLIGLAVDDTTRLGNATAIAQKYVVVNMNYELAPEAKYPVPIIQIGEAYKFINSNANSYNIDMTKIFFGGDSAGAQMAAQFVNIQVNSEYAKLAKIDKVIADKATIKGVILYCGPHNFEKLAKFSNPIFGFFLKRAGWSYSGKSSWAKSEEFLNLSVSHHLTKDFPNVYITDSIKGSFYEHGKEFGEKLIEAGNTNIMKTNFFDAKDVNGEYINKDFYEGAAHEFQFNMSDTNGYKLAKYSIQVFIEVKQLLKDSL